MTMLVYGEKATRTHENQMLSAFLKQLESRWATSTDWILTIANAMWDGAEIDLVCILPTAIIVADFKKHEGKLTGTENGPWQANGVLVKGGRKGNPYHQLRDNKFSVLNWMEAKALLRGRNLGHISAGVLFSGPIDDQLDLPAKVRSWLYPTDFVNCVTLLDNLSSPQLHIALEEALEIVSRLGVQPIDWARSRPQVRDLDSNSASDSPSVQLTEHQREALQAISNFIAMDELTTFSVLGMTSTGKSRLLAEVEQQIVKLNQEAVVLEPNRRLACRSIAEASSIYSHLYVGESSEQNEEQDAGNQVEDKQAENEQEETKVIPLRRCKDNANCVYLVDNSHLLSNTHFSTPDGKQYGSGCLLADFFDFAEIGKSNRKIIFFGDPYQIQRASAEEAVLTGTFQVARGLKHQSLELTQQIDTTGGSAKLANAMKLVLALRARNFSELELVTGDGVRVLDHKDAEDEILHLYRFDPHSVWYLAGTHNQINTCTQWVREHLHGKSSLQPIEIGDLLEIYTSPSPMNPFGERIAIDSGVRCAITGIGLTSGYNQYLNLAKYGKGNSEFHFHSIECEVELPPDRATVKVFEEYLLAPTPELDLEIAAAERALRKRKKRGWTKWKSQQEQKQGNLAEVQHHSDPEPELLPKFTYARYGYASTVHHAQGMSQQICYVDCHYPSGRHSEAFFRWLYSALSVAERELVLLNYRPIHTFDAAHWNADCVTQDPSILIGAGWSFAPDGIVSERDQQRNLPQGLEQSKDVLKSVSIWLHMAAVAEQYGWKVVRAACHDYQERYELLGPKGESCHLQITYSGKNIVTGMRVNDREHWPLLADLACACVDANHYSPQAAVLLRSARLRFAAIGWRILSAIETAYRLQITAACNPNEIISLGISFDKHGQVSSLRPLLCSNHDVVATIKAIFQ
jgi:hypothetical protein